MFHLPVYPYLRPDELDVARHEPHDVIVVGGGLMGIDLGRDWAPDATQCPKFRNLLRNHALGEAHFPKVGEAQQTHVLKVGAGSVVDAVIMQDAAGTQRSRHLGQCTRQVPTAAGSARPGKVARRRQRVCLATGTDPVPGVQGGKPHQPSNA